MRVIYIIMLTFLFLNQIKANSVVYYDLKKALKNPLVVEKLILINGYEKIPEEVRQFVNLKELYLGEVVDYNKTDAYSDIISKQHKYMRKKNNISELPEWLPELREIKVLYLTNNNFTKYPQIINRMPNLEILDMSYNYLIELNCSLKKLKEFYVSLNQEEYPNNKFILPSNVKVLCFIDSYLISSKILNNQLELKKMIFYSVKMKKMLLNDLNSNIESIEFSSSSINDFQVDSSYKLTQLKYLKYSGFLKKYDWISSTAINLKHLDLSFNDIDSIKKDFKFNNLQCVRFDHNKIKYVDSSFFLNNPNLDSVSFYSNNIKSIYTNNINNIEYLNLAHNDINEIFITGFNNLKFLSYNGNLISSSNVPIKDLFVIPHLELVLCENKFEKCKYKGPNYISVNYSKCN